VPHTGALPPQLTIDMTVQKNITTWRKPIMPVRIDTGGNSSYRQGTNSGNRAESAVATIWLVFYVLAVGVAIASPLVARAIETAAR